MKAHAHNHARTLARTHARTHAHTHAHNIKPGFVTCFSLRTKRLFLYDSTDTKPRISELAMNAAVMSMNQIQVGPSMEDFDEARHSEYDTQG